MTSDTNTRIILSTLWIIVMLNMVFADIYSIMVFLVESEIPPIPGDPRTIMLIAVFVTNIPIAMIFLSRVLGRTANRRANFAGAILTIIYVIGGGDASSLHYIAAAAIEVALLVAILWISMRWTASPDASHAHI
ncbi:MAG TPA: hypothetical protein ENK28_06820 [Aliiroseovarius sp.]|nr:hypothetical protein [Aliiroseovarius sp.]